MTNYQSWYQNTCIAILQFRIHYRCSLSMVDMVLDSFLHFRKWDFLWTKDFHQVFIIVRGKVVTTGTVSSRADVAPQTLHTSQSVQEKTFLLSEFPILAVWCWAADLTQQLWCYRVICSLAVNATKLRSSVLVLNILNKTLKLSWRLQQQSAHAALTTQGTCEMSCRVLNENTFSDLNLL